MADSQLICNGCGKQFKTREELQKHEQECAAMRHIQGGQQSAGAGQSWNQPGGNQPSGNQPGGNQPGGNQPSGNQRGVGQGQSQKNQQSGKGQGQQQKNQPEKTRTAGGGGAPQTDQAPE